MHHIDYWSWVKYRDDIEPLEANPDQLGYDPEDIEKEDEIREEKAQQLLRLKEAVNNAGLTRKEKQILTLVYKEGTSITQAAKILKAEKSTVSRRLQRAIQKLKHYLTSKCNKTNDIPTI